MVIFWRDPRFHTGSPHMVMGTAVSMGSSEPFSHAQGGLTTQISAIQRCALIKNRRPSTPITRNLGDHQAAPLAEK